MLNADGAMVVMKQSVTASNSTLSLNSSIAVTVVIPTHNMAPFLETAIDSVLTQSLADFEIIVIDDASTDKTAKKLATMDDPRLHVKKVKISGGPSAARNAGIRMARGEYIAFLDADDVWLPTKLAKQVALLDQDSSLGLVYCGAHIVDPALRFLRTQTTGEAWPLPGDAAFRRIAQRRDFIVAPLSTMVVRKACFDKIGLFDEAIVQAEEWDLAFRLAFTWGIGFVPEPLALYRMGGYFNPEKRLGRRIGEAHEKTIRRAFARLGNPPALEQLKIQALLNTWWGVALYHYAIRQPELARIELTKITAIAPEYLDLRHNLALLTSIAYTAWGLYDTVTPLKEALGFIDYVFDHFPPEVHFARASRRAVKAQACAATAFDSFPRGEIIRVWTAVMAAAAYNPAHLRNFGLLKLLLKAPLSKLDSGIHDIKERGA